YYSNFRGSPSKDSSSILIESVGQPSKASSMSSYNSSGTSAVPWLSSSITYAITSSTSSYISGAAAPQAPHAMHVSISTIVYLAKLLASFNKHAALITQLVS